MEKIYEFEYYNDRPESIIISFENGKISSRWNYGSFAFWEDNLGVALHCCIFEKGTDDRSTFLGCFNAKHHENISKAVLKWAAKRGMEEI